MISVKLLSSQRVDTQTSSTAGALMGIPSSSKTPRNVFLIARPLRSSFWDWISRGNFVLSHWGLLVSKFSRVDLDVALHHSRRSGRNRAGMKEELGTMYDLQRLPNGVNMVNSTRSFLSTSLSDSWPSFAYQFVGITTVNDEDISKLGLPHPKCR